MKRMVRIVVGAVFCAGSLSAVAQTGRPVTNSVEMALVPIPPGSFTMGEEEGPWDRSPARTVTLTRGFLMAAEEVTEAQFREFRPEARVAVLDGAVCGISRQDAVAFCRWLSEQEGRPYRLPTEAEWEYACRAGDRTPFPGGSERPDPGTANGFGLRNMNTGVAEWCRDRYGDYAPADRVDPVGPDGGIAYVVRGGGADTDDDLYAQAAARAGYPPDFGIPHQEPGEDARMPGLTGEWFGNPDLTRPIAPDRLPDVQRDWSADSVRGTAWSGRWEGLYTPGREGRTAFRVESDGPVRLTLAGKTVIDTFRTPGETEGSLVLPAGDVPIRIEYGHRGGVSFLRLHRALPGRPEEPVPAAAVGHRLSRTVRVGSEAGAHRIGFRVVLAPDPETVPRPALVFDACDGVFTGIPPRQGPAPDPTVPFFRRRKLLPTPPETAPDGRNDHEIRAAGFHPSFRGHNHSPALEVCPNGDVLAVFYTSHREYEPEVSLIAVRLRYGADEWDAPSRFLDIPGANDHAPLLMTDGEVLRLFWGHPRTPGAFPFQWIESRDSGATWGEVRFPRFSGPVGPHSRQPVNTALRDANGVLLISSDGEGGTSLLWRSADGGDSWEDPGGRTFGRHTTFALLADGRILGMGGKNTDVEGYMPKSLSSDSGQTWIRDKTPFPALGGNQRPSLLRLRSGRLFFAGDFQRQGGIAPAGEARRGSYVALSEDEGETWRIRPLPGALPHENPDFLKGEATLGYSAARQGRDGVIHLITTMNRPCLHFALNEAWILTGGESSQPPVASGPGTVTREDHTDGTPRVSRTLARSREGFAVLHGPERRFFPDGTQAYEAEWRDGRRVGREVRYRPDGSVLWLKEYESAGTFTWRQYDPAGTLAAESVWRDGVCVGVARRFDPQGRVTVEHRF